MIRCPWRTRAVAAVAIVAVVAVAGGATPASAGIPSPAVKPGANMVVHMNLWGAKGNPDGGWNPDIAQAVLNSLKARTNPYPLVVSFNEICETQWLSLWNNYFGLHSYVAEAHWGTSVSGTCGRFGNVVAVRGSAAIRSHGSFSNQATNQTGVGWVCVASNLYSRDELPFRQIEAPPTEPAGSRRGRPTSGQAQVAPRRRDRSSGGPRHKWRLRRSDWRARRQAETLPGNW